MQENHTQKPVPKKENKPWFVLLFGFFLLIRGIMRLSEGDIAVMGILMIIVGAAGIAYYFVKR